MKLPCDLSGAEICHCYRAATVNRKSDNLETTFALALPSRAQNTRLQSVHSPLKVGTLPGILLEIAAYLEISKEVRARRSAGGNDGVVGDVFGKKKSACSVRNRGGGSRSESGGFLEFEFGGVAEGVEDAEEEIRGDVFGVAVHDGGDAGARGTREARDLSMR